jgi:hypothetical protein
MRKLRNYDGDLLPDHEAGLRQFVRQEFGTERIGDGEGAPNETLGNTIETSAVAFIGGCDSFQRGSISLGRKLTADSA